VNLQLFELYYILNIFLSLLNFKLISSNSQLCRKSASQTPSLVGSIGLEIGLLFSVTDGLGLLGFGLVFEVTVGH